LKQVNAKVYPFGISNMYFDDVNSQELKVNINYLVIEEGGEPHCVETYGSGENPIFELWDMSELLESGSLEYGTVNRILKKPELLTHSGVFEKKRNKIHYVFAPMINIKHVKEFDYQVLG
jgi:hypothetical protein